MNWIYAIALVLSILTFGFLFINKFINKHSTPPDSTVRQVFRPRLGLLERLGVPPVADGKRKKIPGVRFKRYGGRRTIKFHA
jgi:hypothetical protein